MGPISGPISAGMATKLMASRNWSLGKARSTTRRPTGISMAPPTPCSTRAAISWFSVAEAAQAMEPVVNRAMASVKMRRVPKRSASQPVAGMTTAMVSA